MTHAAVGLDFLWRHLPPEELLHEESDVDNLSFHCSLAEAGMTPCLLVNLGSALTIEEVPTVDCSLFLLCILCWCVDLRRIKVKL